MSSIRRSVFLADVARRAVPRNSVAARFALGFIIAVLAPNVAHAQLSWNPAGPSNNWNLTDANWTGASTTWTQGEDADFSASPAETIVVTVPITVDDITFGLAGYGISSSGAGNLTLADANSDFNVTATATTGVINETIANPTSGAGGFTKLGGGALTYQPTSASTYTGPTILSAGTMTVNVNGFAGGGAVSLGSGTTLIMGSGAAGYTNNFSSVTAGSGTTTGGTARFAATGAAPLSGNWSGFSGVYEHNIGTQSTVFNSTAAASGNAAYVQLLGGSAQGFIPNVTAGGTYNLGSIATTVAAAVIRNGNTVTGTSTVVIGNLNTSTTWAGSIGNSGGGTLALTKVGTGTLTLSRATGNGYTGGTIINGGTLSVTNTSGSGTGTGAVTVNSGGTLGGTGIVAGNVSSSGSISPGTSVGSFTINGTPTPSLSLLAGNYTYEINSATVAADLTSIAGNLSISGGVALVTSELGSGLLAMGTKFTLLNYGGTWNGGTFNGLPNYSTTLTIGANRFQIIYNDTSGGTNFGGGSFGTSGQPHWVTITAVPEASSILVFGMGGIFAVAAVWISKRFGSKATIS